MINMYTDLEVRVREFARKARRDEGATAVEYGLMVALIAVVIIAAVDPPGQQRLRHLQHGCQHHRLTSDTQIDGVWTASTPRRPVHHRR